MPKGVIKNSDASRQPNLNRRYHQISSTPSHLCNHHISNSVTLPHLSTTHTTPLRIALVDYENSSLGPTYREGLIDKIRRRVISTSKGKVRIPSNTDAARGDFSHLTSKVNGPSALCTRELYDITEDSENSPCKTGQCFESDPFLPE